MSAIGDPDAKSKLAELPYMVLKRVLIEHGVETAKSASNKEHLIQIIENSSVDVQLLLSTAQNKVREEAEAKTKLEQVKAGKEAERRAAADAANAAEKQTAEELSLALAAKFTHDRLIAFVEENLDCILKSGLFSQATGDGMNRLRVADGVYNMCAVERGCDWGLTEIMRSEAAALVVNTLNDAFHKVGCLDSAGALLYPKWFTIDRWDLSRPALQRVLQDFLASFPA
jgi:hypothetical protein